MLILFIFALFRLYHLLQTCPLNVEDGHETRTYFVPGSGEHPTKNLKIEILSFPENLNFSNENKRKLG